MRKTAGLENSGVSDSQYGLAIFVSTTARLAFRSENPEYEKVRNKQLNYQIGQLYASASPTHRFKPKKGEQGAVGEIREGSGSKFISIVYGSHISVIFVKEVPSIPAPVDGIPLTSSMKNKGIKKGASYQDYFTNHLRDRVEVLFGLTKEEVNDLIDYLLKFHDGDLRTLLKSLVKKQNRGNLEKLIQRVHHQELSTKPVYDTLHPSDAFSVPAGEPLSVVDLDPPITIN